MSTSPESAGKAMYNTITSIAITVTAFGLGYIAIDCMFTAWSPSARPYIRTIFPAITIMWIATVAIGIRVTYTSAHQLYSLLHKQRR